MANFTLLENRVFLSDVLIMEEPSSNSLSRLQRHEKAFLEKLKKSLASTSPGSNSSTRPTLMKGDLNANDGVLDSLTSS